MKRNLVIFFVAAFVLLALGDLIFPPAEGHGGMLGIHFPGLFAFFGLIACMGIIILSKWLGHYWLQKKEDYYRRRDKDE